MPAAASVALRDIARGLEELPHRSMVTIVRAVKELATEEARRATGDGRMSRVGRRGARLGARDTITAEAGAQVLARVQGVPVGPWVWANTGTTRHRIARITRGRRLRGGEPDRALMWPGARHPQRGPVTHPGTAGKGAWRRVVTRAQQVVPDIFAAEVHRTVTGA